MINATVIKTIVNLMDLTIVKFLINRAHIQLERMIAATETTVRHQIR